MSAVESKVGYDRPADRGDAWGGGCPQIRGQPGGRRARNVKDLRPWGPVRPFIRQVGKIVPIEPFHWEPRSAPPQAIETNLFDVIFIFCDAQDSVISDVEREEASWQSEIAQPTAGH